MFEASFCKALLVENGKFLLSAKRTQRTTYTEYVISVDADNISRSSNTYIGKLRGTTATGIPILPNYEAVRHAQELAVRMGFRQDPQFAPLINMFMEEGKWSKDVETIKLKSKFGEAQAKEQKAKQAQLAKAKAAPNINLNLIEITESCN